MGRAQCEALQEQMKDNLEIAKDIELIVVSPMRRTLETVQLGLGWLLEKQIPVQVRGEWQETSNSPCDTGTDIRVIEKEYPSFNFDTVFPEWPSKTGRWAFTQEAIEQRGRDCRNWLMNRPEKAIAVVSHSAFLRIGIVPMKWSNADYRIFDFAKGGSNELVEWSLTADNGGGMGRSPLGFMYPTPSDFALLNEVARDRAGEAV
jgi:broad specificity phosphatase PhoE